MSYSIGETKPGSIVYLKKENLATYIPYDYAKKYTNSGCYISYDGDPLKTRMYPLNAARVIKIDFLSSSSEQPEVKVEMLCDKKVWVLPYSMIEKPGLVYSYSTTESWDCTGFMAKKFNVDEVFAIPTRNRYVSPKYDPARIIYNDPATIVFWKDGTKTVVKRMPKEKFNPYNAFCAALAKKVFGTNSRVCKIVNNGEDQTKKKIEAAKAKPKKK